MSSVCDRSVVAVVVAARPDSLPAPRCGLPRPARAAIEPNAGNERCRGKGEEGAVAESVEASEREPIGARRKSWPEREAWGPDDPTAESGTAEPSAYGRAAEPSAYRRAAEPSAYRRAEETARHSAAKATAHRAVKATASMKTTTSVEAATPAHPGMRCR